jgi:hypothetical protein
MWSFQHRKRNPNSQAMSESTGDQENGKAINELQRSQANQLPHSQPEIYKKSQEEEERCPVVVQSTLQLTRR